MLHIIGAAVLLSLAARKHLRRCFAKTSVQQKIKAQTQTKLLQLPHLLNSCTLSTVFTPTPAQLLQLLTDCRPGHRTNYPQNHLLPPAVDYKPCITKKFTVPQAY